MDARQGRCHTVCEVVAHHDTSLVGIDRTSASAFPRHSRTAKRFFRFNLRLLGSRIIALLGGRLEYEQSIDYGSLHRLGRLDSRSQQPRCIFVPKMIQIRFLLWRPISVLAIASILSLYRDNRIT